MTMLSWLLFLFASTASIVHGAGNSKRITDQSDTLNVLRDQKIAYSFNSTFVYSEHGTKIKVPNRFEASDLVIRPDGRYMYVVFDNTYQIGAFCTPSALKKKDCTDKLLEWPDTSVHKLDSEFEGIAYNPLRESYYVAQEVMPTTEKPAIFKPIIIEIRITSTNFPVVQIVESCAANFSFTSRSKGFEGLEFVTHQQTGKNYLLALCEANFCGSKSLSIRKNDDLGNGRLVVLEKKAATSSQSCYWSPIGLVNLPASIKFLDYSAMSIFRRNPLDQLPSYIAVTTQEDSQVFIGVIEEIAQSPYFKVSTLPKNTVYEMPRRVQSKGKRPMQYCNIEGVTWQGKNKLIIVSDKAKDDQDAACTEKDQSLHYFSFPKSFID